MTQPLRASRRISPALQYTLMSCVGVLSASLAVATFATGQTAAPKPPAKPAAAAAAPAAAPAKAAAADPAKAEPEFQVLTQLRNAGVKTCLQTAQGLGAYTMNGVTEYAATSTWSPKQPDGHLVVSTIGQKFGNAAAAPMAISSVFSAPNAAGKCDGAGVQVIPSSVSCQQIQAQILQKGKALADLAGIPMMQDQNNGRVMLMPSAGNGCVIVGFNNLYSE